MKIYYETNELKHYGVLGMKWGIRRDKYIESHKVPKGTKIYRTTANSGESTDGVKYVSYIDVDRDNYRSKDYGGKFIQKYAKNKSSLYEKQYELKEDLNVAGRKDIQEAIDDIYKNNKDLLVDTVRKDQWKLYTDRYIKVLDDNKDYYLNTKNISEDDFNYTRKIYIEQGKRRVEDTIKKMDNSDARRFLTANTFGGHKELRQKVIDILKKKGFNSMVDEASVGDNDVGRVGVDPLIVFDGRQSMDEIRTQKLDAMDSMLSTKRYKKWLDVSEKARKLKWGKW